MTDMLKNPMVQSAVLGVGVYCILMKMKPGFMYSVDGQLKKPMVSPMTVSVAVALGWFGFKRMKKGGSESGTIAETQAVLANNASFGAEIQSTAQAGVANGDTFYE
jgi:hypothetical protein